MEWQKSPTLLNRFVVRSDTSRTILSLLRVLGGGSKRTDILRNQGGRTNGKRENKLYGLRFALEILL